MWGLSTSISIKTRKFISIFKELVLPALRDNVILEFYTHRHFSEL